MCDHRDAAGHLFTRYFCPLCGTQLVESIPEDMPQTFAEYMRNDLRADFGYSLVWSCRDIGYGVEEGEGVYIYRTRDMTGKFVFEDVESEELIHLFGDEILEITWAERVMFEVVVEAYRKPTTANWQRFAYTKAQAQREAIDAGRTEWPDAVEVRATVLDSTAGAVT